MIKEMYYGKVIPCERKNRAAEKQQDIIKRIVDEGKYLADKMLPADAERFQKLSELYSEILELE